MRSIHPSVTLNHVITSCFPACVEPAGWSTREEKPTPPELLLRVPITRMNTDPPSLSHLLKHRHREKGNGEVRTCQLFNKEVTESSPWTPKHADACRAFHGLSDHQRHSQCDMVLLTQAALGEEEAAQRWSPGGKTGLR